MDERYELTEKDFVFGEANGIPRRNVKYRVESQGWSIERAISTPLRKTSHNYGWEERKEIAALSGVFYNAYYYRVTRGMDRDDAARKPISHTQKNESKEWTEWKEVAKQNGVNAVLFRTRIKNGWNHERAATTKPYPRRGRREKKKNEITTIF